MEKSGENKAAKLFQEGQYQEAADIYSGCLTTLQANNDIQAGTNLLFNRSTCYLKLKLYDKVTEDCDAILSVDDKNSKALNRKIKALCSVGKFSDAHNVAQNWMNSDPQNVQAQKELERLDIVLKALHDQEGEEDALEHVEGNVIAGERIPPEGREDSITQTQKTATNNNNQPKSVVTTTNGKDGSSTDDPQASFPCTYCSVTFGSKEELKAHCGSDLHKKKISSDEGREWKYRPPPRGLTSDEYTLCPRNFGEGTCRFGDKCSQAHSDAELEEWKERFEYKKQRMKKAKESDLQGNSYAEQLLERWMSAENPETVMTDNLEGVNVHVNSDLSVNMSTKRCSNSWTFTITSRTSLKRVALLDDASRKYFYVSALTVGPKRSQKAQQLEDQCQEWTNPNFEAGKTSNEKVYRIKIVFRTDIYGTFRQSVVCDFGEEPVLVRQLCVDSTPVVDIDRTTQSLVFSDSGRWDITTKEIVPFEPRVITLNQEEIELLEKYPPPIAAKFTMSPALMEPELKRETYRARMHSLLCIEEMAQYSSIAKYNVKVSLQLVNRFLLMPSTVSTAKFAQGGELFAQMKLNADISEDTSHGRLILQNVSMVYLSPYDPNGPEHQEPQKIYEAVVEDKGKNFIYLRLSNKCVSELKLQGDCDFPAQVQFELNRLPLAEMHLALDRLPDVSLVFPKIESLSNIPWTPKRNWDDQLDVRLNARQKEAVVAITTSLEHKLPPILLVGPYGTGKTFTLAEAARQILKQENTRVLICTHSNSAADLYIKDYLHPFVEDNCPEARPLRVYYRSRWVQTVNHVVLKYCLLGGEGTTAASMFRMPSKKDVENHRIVVATLSTSRYLYDIGLEAGFFTHILLDEAAQACECETIMPLALAGHNTRLVLAGDHMQLSPEIHSDFARERNLHVSFLERLYDLYPTDNPCKILLCENYRSHKAIIDYTSELFYDNQLVSSGNQPRHEVFYPLTFFTARGEDMQHQNSTAFYNNAEVYEVVERVVELQKMWPKSWGSSQEDTSIGVVSPYADQVVRIRAELRKRKIFNVSVERVFNVQGKQFRAMFLSTVRTRHTCSSDSSLEDYMDYGFLSNVKLLNTAITRAQSLVAVVGDPVSLSSIGKCRKLWERFLEICHKQNSLYGITWNHLRAQLDGVELKKTYILNPLAPEFVPNRLRHAPYQPPEPIGVGKYGHMFTWQPSNWGYRHSPYMPPPPPPQMYYPWMPPMTPKAGHFPPMYHYDYLPPMPQMLGPKTPRHAFPPGSKPSNSPKGSPGIDSTAGTIGSAATTTSSTHSALSSTSGAVSKTTASATATTSSSQNNQSYTVVSVTRPGTSTTNSKASDTPAVSASSTPSHKPPGGPPPVAANLMYQTSYPPPPFPPPPHSSPYRMPYHVPAFPSGPMHFHWPQTSPIMPPRQLGSPGHHGNMFNPHQLLGAPLGGRIPPPATSTVSPGGTPFGSPSQSSMLSPQALSQPFMGKGLHGRSVGPSSPSGSDHPIKILPNTCNVKSPMPGPVSPGGGPQVGGASVSKQSHTITNRQEAIFSKVDDKVIIQNPHLQREIYSYILQTEGATAANSFMATVQERSKRLSASQANSLKHIASNSGPPMKDIGQSPTKSRQKRESVTVSVRLDESPRGAIHDSTLGGSMNLMEFASHASSQSALSLPLDQARGTLGSRGNYGHQRSAQVSVKQAGKWFAKGNNVYSSKQHHKAAFESRPPTVDYKNMYSHNGQLNMTQADILEDLERPTAVDHMVKFIEESLEERSTESDLGNIHIGQSPVKIPTLATAKPTVDRAVPLYMRRGGQGQVQGPVESAPMSYAGALRRQPAPPPPASMMRPPPVEDNILHDPAAVAIGGTIGTIGSLGSMRNPSPLFPEHTSDLLTDLAEDGTDPLDVLKNLNIKASPGTQAFYQYFS